jgi:hypothetical protein
VRLYKLSIRVAKEASETAVRLTSSPPSFKGTSYMRYSMIQTAKCISHLLGRERRLEMIRYPYLTSCLKVVTQFFQQSSYMSPFDHDPDTPPFLRSGHPASSLLIASEEYCHTQLSGAYSPSPHIRPVPHFISFLRSDGQFAPPSLRERSVIDRTLLSLHCHLVTEW